MKINIVKKQIMWGDLDALGIVFYPRYSEWIDASGHLFFESIDLIINDLWHQKNIQFTLVSTSCNYYSPGRYHQKIVIKSCIETLKSKIVELKHEIYSEKDDILMVRGIETRICTDVTDPDKFRAMNIPEDIYLKLSLACDR
ncbi:MAG: acyl-CoA thioesterase [Proteobacteria bacterium]|nr:acyl-CoA thioesterase [Pseudomonadota bacterium]